MQFTLLLVCDLYLQASIFNKFQYNFQKRLTEKSTQNEAAELEIYNLKLSSSNLEKKFNDIKLSKTEQLSSFQDEIQGKEELIQELQSIIKGVFNHSSKILNLII